MLSRCQQRVFESSLTKNRHYTHTGTRAHISISHLSATLSAIMFSFRRKHQKKDSQFADGPPTIRTSPSLPELSAQGIPWPANLVDLSALPSSPNGEVAMPQSPSQGAAKTSLHSSDKPIPFHKPFRSPTKDVRGEKGGISSLYMASHPPVAFENRKSSFASRPRPSQKRSRNPTTFNIMVRVFIVSFTFLETEYLRYVCYGILYPYRS